MHAKIAFFDHEEALSVPWSDVPFVHQPWHVIFWMIRIITEQWKEQGIPFVAMKTQIVQ
jgi:hypothetical protein